MIHCIIVDDKPHGIELLSNYISKIPDLLLTAAYESSLAALHAIQSNQIPDLVFMDIELPMLSGIELAKQLPCSTGVIYVTSHNEFALESFDTNVIDFLTKPVSFARFIKAVAKSKILLPGNHRQSFLPAECLFFNPGIKGKMVKVELGQIIYIEGLKNYIILHVAAGKHIAYLTMMEIQSGLPANRFMRVHKSYIINLAQLHGLEGNMIVLSTGQKLPIGGVYKNELMNYINSTSIISKR